MITLTDANYFKQKTGALTHSKIKDYSICPNYFYRKHIECSVEQEEKSAFLFGGIVDKLLSGERFGARYHVVERRTPTLKKEAEANGWTLLNETEYREIIEVASAVEKTDAFKYIMDKAGDKAQTILQVGMDINEHFNCLAGKPDWQWAEGDTLYTVDLKTAMTVDPRRYFYNAIGFHYDSQLANYEDLYVRMNPGIKNFRSFNLAVSKQKDIYSVELFEYPRNIISSAKFWLEEQLDKIKNEKEYLKYNPSFNSPAVFGAFRQEADVDMIDDDENS